MKRKHLKFIIMCLLAFILSINVLVFADSGDIKILLNGSVLETSAQPIIENGTSLVPMRSIFEALGMGISWDELTETITGTGKDVTIKLTIGSNIAYLNDVEKKLSAPAKIIDGSTMVPLKFISESVGYDVSWDGTKRRVSINAKDYIPATVTEGDIYLESTNQMASSDELYSVNGKGTYTGYKMLKGYPNEHKFQIYYKGDASSYMTTIEDLRGINLNNVVTWKYNGASYKNTTKDLYRFFADTSWFRSNLGISDNTLSHDWFVQTFGDTYMNWIEGIAYSNDAERLVGKYLDKISGIEVTNRYGMADMSDQISKAFETKRIADEEKRRQEAMEQSRKITNDWITANELDRKKNVYVSVGSNIDESVFYYSYPYKKLYTINIPRGWNGEEIEVNGIRLKKDMKDRYYNVDDLIKVGIIEGR